MKVTTHFKDRLQTRFKMDIVQLEKLLEQVPIEYFNKNQWIPFHQLEKTFLKYPYSTLICVEELNMCLVSDNTTKTLITVYQINN